MDFMKATDALFVQLTSTDLAKEIGVAGQTVRKARVAAGSTAARNPPPGWEKAAALLAEKQARHFQKLAERLRASV